MNRFNRGDCVTIKKEYKDEEWVREYNRFGKKFFVMEYPYLFDIQDNTIRLSNNPDLKRKSLQTSTDCYYELVKPSKYSEFKKFQDEQ